MDLVGQNDRAVFVGAELILCVDQDQTTFGRDFLAALEERQRIGGERLPLLFGQKLLLDDLGRRQRLVMPAIEFLAGGVMIGSGSSWLSFMPSGKVTPYMLRSPFL